MEVDPVLRGLFFEETAANVTAAQKALGAGDLAVVARAFHTLAGSAGLMGYRAWGEVASLAERLARLGMGQRNVTEAETKTLTDALAAVAAFAAGDETPPPVILVLRLAQGAGPDRD